MEALDKEYVLASLVDLQGWKVAYNGRQKDLPEGLYASKTYAAFAEAMEQVNRVVATVQGHEDHFAFNVDHLGVNVYGFPGYARVTFLIRTCNEKEEWPVFGVAEQDIALARAISCLIDFGHYGKT